MSSSNLTISSKLIGAEGLALLIGAILTPVAIGLSLQFLPVIPALLIYGIIAGFFAFRNPHQSWEWGLWAFGGMVIALLIGILMVGSVALWNGEQMDVSSVWGTLRATSIFGFIPALAGGCLGGLIGSNLSREKKSS